METISSPQLNSTARADSPVTLVFTDMVGSSAAKRSSSLGRDMEERDRAFLERIQSRHLHLVRECVAAHNGKEIMTIGDSFFLTFEDVRSAVLCSAEIQMRLKSQPIMTATGPMQLRIGIHVGTPYFFENSWHGTDVDTAARAEAAGAPEQIILTGDAYASLGEMEAIRFTPLGTFALRGVGNVPLWDADYDQHGPRKANILSLEEASRERRWQIFSRIAASLLVVASLTGAFYWWRAHSHAPLTANDQILVGDFDNRTSDPLFDTTLKQVFAQQMAESPVLQIVSSQQLQSELRALNKPLAQPLTAAVARAIGQHGGIRVFTTGGISLSGDVYALTVEAIDSASGRIYTEEKTAVHGRDNVMPALASLATKMREALGESLGSIERYKSSEWQAATSSLDALHAYSLGMEEQSRMHPIPEAEMFYKQAIELDPRFAMAYYKLATVYFNVGRTQEAIHYIDKAYEYRELGGEHERMAIEALQAWFKSNQAAAVPLFKKLLANYPNDGSAWNNLSQIFILKGNYEEALYASQQATLHASWNHFFVQNEIWLKTQMGKFDGINQLLQKEKNAGVPIPAHIEIVRKFAEGDASWRHQQVEPMDDDLASQKYTLALAVGDRALAEQMVELIRQASGHDDIQATFANNVSSMAYSAASMGMCDQASKLFHATDHMHNLDMATAGNFVVSETFCGRSYPSGDFKKLAGGNPKLEAYLRLTIRVASACVRQRPWTEEIPEDSLNRLKVDYPDLPPCLMLLQHHPDKAIQSMQTVFNYKYTSLQAGIMSYPKALFFKAQAQTMMGDHAGAIRTYKELLTDWWGSADPQFGLAAQAKQQLEALQRQHAS